MFLTCLTLQAANCMMWFTFGFCNVHGMQSGHFSITSILEQQINLPMSSSREDTSAHAFSCAAYSCIWMTALLSA